MAGREAPVSVLTIRPAAIDDRDAIWAIIKPIIRAANAFALPQDMGRTDAMAYWLGADRHVFVAEMEGEILGTYFIRSNQLGGGGHVANGAYATAAHANGRGVARAMCAHSLEEARRLGFYAMQFNFVVSSNVRAVRLWRDMGFEVVGTLPKAFQHPELGLVDALVMFRLL
jgi:ribosomal protein S18 acetylase RimI-like enzyme